MPFTYSNSRRAATTPTANAANRIRVLLELTPTSFLGDPGSCPPTGGALSGRIEIRQIHDPVAPCSVRSHGPERLEQPGFSSGDPRARCDPLTRAVSPNEQAARWS